MDLHAQLLESVPTAGIHERAADERKRQARSDIGHFDDMLEDLQRKMRDGLLGAVDHGPPKGVDDRLFGVVHFCGCAK